MIIFLWVQHENNSLLKLKQAFVLLVCPVVKSSEKVMV